jgi:hypothetical protein
MNRDYIPGGDRAFLVWIVNLLLYLMGRVTKFKYPQDDYDLLEQEKNVYNQKLDVAEGPATRTPVNVKSKNFARRVLEKHIRKSVKSYLIDNPLLTEDDLTMLGLPIHKTTRTPVPQPANKVDFTIEPKFGSRLVVHYHAHEDDADRRSARPYGVHGVEIAWAILDTPPTAYEELVHSTFDSRPPYTFQFNLTDAGKHFYCCLRWENTRGEKGPWSEIQSAIIP